MATERTRPLIALAAIGLLLLPMLAAATPVQSPESTVEGWWSDTSMDVDQDGIHDVIWMAIDSTQRDWVQEDGTLSVIVNFDHLPSLGDEKLLTDEVDFVVFHRFHLIDSIAGSVPVSRIEVLASLPGVVMVELDGILEVSNSEVKDVHGVWDVYTDTGYNGAGSVVAIIDTGIDGLHESLDDLDDDNSTNDPKIIAFYDTINNPTLTNGTEVFPYDDHGHGSHCAGTTAGTGAPNYEHTGMAPQAQLVGVKVLSGSGSGSFAQVMMGMEWVVEKRHEFNIRAASMSLGGPGSIEWTSSEEDSVNRMANEMVRAGVALFIAAGNNAVSAQIGTPGSAEDVITVGALDKDTSIAIYSSQGPTEEGRVKPNIAFVGSSVMSVDANTGTGYTAMSGTSMATPGAAGVAALMYQANPDLSPFDIRNIMQETATYRQCHYMLANEMCPEDAIPKNRQNNVYGHGEVRALDSVLEAANRVYGLDTGIGVNMTSGANGDNKVHVGNGDAVQFTLDSDVDKIQWRTWDRRDEWMDLEGFEPEDRTFEIDHDMFVDRLKYLPGNAIEGNQTLIVRAIHGDNASTNVVTHLHIMGAEKSDTSDDEGGFFTMPVVATGLSFMILLLLIGVGVLVIQLRDARASIEFDEPPIEAEFEE
jgi:serine protease AprX